MTFTVGVALRLGGGAPVTLLYGVAPQSRVILRVADPLEVPAGRYVDVQVIANGRWTLRFAPPGSAG